jgi:DNA-binding response OmpR family regulator/anti-sigma regulatory factor (Ser/Thr protein kinase)
MRVLIIEDDSLFAEILQTFLEGNDCTTVVAETISDATLQVKSSHFDFVLLDNHLPDGDGIHCIEKLKTVNQSGRSLPIIMITADHRQHNMLEAFEYGVDDFLAKPLSLDLLWQKMQRVKSVYDKEVQLAKQAYELNALLDKQAQEEELARYVYEHVASAANNDVEHINTYLQASSTFNGDLFISDISPNGNRMVILADATGHGLAAAISVLPLVATIKAMIKKGLSLAHIVHEANKKLCSDLPDDKFVALIGVEVNFYLQQIHLFNGGMPDVIALDFNHKTHRHPSTTMALGILEPEDFDPNIITLEADSIKNLFFFSDGLVEQENPQKEPFGMHRVTQLIENNKSTEPLLSHIVNHFSVFNEMQELQDDLSICDVEVKKLLDKQASTDLIIRDNKSGKVCASILVEGGLIGRSDIVGWFDNLMRSVDVSGDLRQRAFTVFAELISNAIDHGILKLDSKLKTDYAGFAEYLMLKEERLIAIGDEEKITMQFEYCEVSTEMKFDIIDSGPGYDLQASTVMDDESLSGRGLSLIEQLCKSVTITPPGNQTSVVIKESFK